MCGVEEVEKLKNNHLMKNIIKLCVFLSIANLPFLTMSQIMGMDLFLDTFENTEYYISIRSNECTMNPNITDKEYIIFQRTSHPDFDLEEGDTILYHDNGEATYHKISQITYLGSIKQYQLEKPNNDPQDSPICEKQIIGKVVGIVDNNLWNQFSLDVWKMTTRNLNFVNLFSK